MLTFRLTSSFSSACSSRFAFARTNPLSRSFHPNSQLKLYTKPTPRQPSILHHARGFSSHGANLNATLGTRSGLGLGITFLGAGLGFAALAAQRNAIKCEAPKSSRTPPIYSGADTSIPPLEAPPQSSINIYELSFGTVCGVCAGVFIKKGVKALAFVLGGVFVMLQYFTSLHLTRVDWGSAESRFNKVFYTVERDPSGREIRRTPTIYSLWSWLVNFLTADFPPRATFIAGMILGLRIG